MTCLTGGLTPCSAATGIPGRQATSSSPTCRAGAVLTKAFLGTPWSGARPTAAAQPGTARDTTRPTRHPPPPLGSQAGSHHHPTQGDREPTKAFDTPAVTRHSATVADGSRQTGSRSHRGSPLSSTPPPHAKVPFQRCALRHLTHMPKVVRCSAGCLYTALHGHSRSRRLRTRFTDFPDSIDMHTWTNQIDAESVLMEKRVAFHPGKLRGQAAHGWVQLPRSWQIAAAAFSSRRGRGALWLRSAGISSSGAGASCSGMIWVARRVRCPGQREVPGKRRHRLRLAARLRRTAGPGRVLARRKAGRRRGRTDRR